MGVRVNPGRRTLKNVYRTYVDVICYKKGDASRVNLKDDDALRTELTEQDQTMVSATDHAIAD